MIKDSNDHINKANESYFINFFLALKIGIKMIMQEIQALILSIIPEILTKSASDKLKKLHEIVSKKN